MTKPAHRSRHLRKVFYRTPAGRTRARHKRRSPRRPSCALCAKPLAGRKPGRKYAKTLCHACTELVITTKKLGLEASPRLKRFL